MSAHVPPGGGRGELELGRRGAGPMGGGGGATAECNGVRVEARGCSEGSPCLAPRSSALYLPHVQI